MKEVSCNTDMISQSECSIINNTSQQDLNRKLFCCPVNYYSNRKDLEGDPMIYIVTMLIVFSAGIASLMIIYMKKVFPLVD